MIQLKLSKFHNRLAIVSVLIYNTSSQVHVLRPDFRGSSYQNHGAFLSVPQLFRMVRSSTSDDLTIVFFIHDGVFFLRRKYLVFHLWKSTETFKLPFQQLQTNFWRRLSLLKPANTNRNQPKRVGSSLVSPVGHPVPARVCWDFAKSWEEVVFYAGGENFLKSGRPHWKWFGRICSIIKFIRSKDCLSFSLALHLPFSHKRCLWCSSHLHFLGFWKSVGRHPSNLKQWRLGILNVDENNVLRSLTQKG